jgi:hypothetical protein
MPAHSLFNISPVFQQLTDPRDPRGVRFPYHALCSLVFLGLLARICEMAVLVRWAKAHWDQLREPLGFTRPETPSATCLSRSLAKLSLAEFRSAFAQWITPLLEPDSPLLCAAIDGKTCCQGHDEHGDPEILLNVFLHDLKLAISQFPVGKSKTNEPGCLKENLKDLLQAYPMLNLLTGDAIFLQRPLLEVLQEHGCDYLFRVKDNQPDTVEALGCCFDDAVIGPAKVETVDKKGALSRSVVFGTISMMPSGFVTLWVCMGAR